MMYKKIQNIDQYNLYSEVHETLALKDYNGNKDEIELIEILIDEYENRTNDYSGIMEPVELLNYILEENGMSKAELSRQLQVSKQLISDILGYRRNISKGMIMKLSDLFKMQPLAFARNYELKIVPVKELVINS